MSDQLIGAPFFRDNEYQLQRIGKAGWEYRTVFAVEPVLSLTVPEIVPQISRAPGGFLIT